MEITHKEVFNLIRKIWGKKTKKGFCWILDKFGDSRLDRMSTRELETIYECLASKKEGLECPVHMRFHNVI